MKTKKIEASLYDFRTYLYLIDIGGFCLLVGLITWTMLKSFYPYWDSLAYHLPYGARLSGIFNNKQYIFLPHLENMYKAFPLLPFYLEGWLWKITGTVSAASLMNVFTLCIFAIYIWRKFNVPLTVTSLFYFSVPILFLNFFSYYYDCFVGTFLALSFLSVYQFIKKNNNGDFSLIILFITFVNAGKYTGVIFTAVLYIVFCLYLIWKRLSKHFVIFVLLYPLMFFYPIRNLIIYKDPFYPTHGDMVEMAKNKGSGTNIYYSNESNNKKFLKSFFEINTFDKSRPTRWVVDMGNVPESSSGFRLGGYFYVNIIYWLLMICIYVIVMPRKKTRLYMFIGWFLLVLLISFIPNSFELRYFIFLPILLFSMFFIDFDKTPNFLRILLVFGQLLIFLRVLTYLYPVMLMPKAGFENYNLKSIGHEKICMVKQWDSRSFFLYRLGTDSNIDLQAASETEQCNQDYFVLKL